MTFQHPWMFLLALLLPLAWRGWWRRRGGVGFAPAMFLAGGPASWRTRTAALPALLQALGLACAVVALARPVERTPLPHETEGIDILVCLDTSSSMAQRDLEGNRTRLDVAKQAAATFVAGRAGDRIGVVTFARYPDLVCPPTLDHEAVLAFLRDIELVAGDGPEDATGLGTATARLAEVLARGGARSKVAILLTDGEENVAVASKPEEIAPDAAAQLCKALGVRVYSIAAGRGRRLADGTWRKLDSASLRTVARRTGGKFFEARAAGSLEAVYREIDELETEPFADPRYETAERFSWFVLAALALLLAGRMLGSTAWAVQA